MIKVLSTIFFLAFTTYSVAQNSYVNSVKPKYTSIHQEQSNFYKQYNFTNEAQYDALTPGVPQKKASNPGKMQACSLQYAVYGWHPYWVGTAYTNYDFSLLSTFSYFSYELVPSTGGYSSIHSWKTTNSVDLALAAGCKVELCVTNFGSSNNTTFLTSGTAQQTFIDTIISLINYRGAHGVNIDFEGVPGSQKNNLTAFMQNLSVQLKAAISGGTVTMAVYSVDWNDVFDIPALDPFVDQFVIMGYGYYYGGSSVAGPTAEFYKGTIWSNYNLVRSVNYYLNEGITPSKLILGLPYYGYEWETASNSVPSTTTSTIGSRTFSYVKNNYLGVHDRFWDGEGFNNYYIYQSGGNWRQAWVDDERSLSHRYDMVIQKDIGGIGIWALGYDNGYSELWNLIYEKFTGCGTVGCSDTIYDMGGPFGDHYNNEAYQFTIAPTNASSVSLTFNTFNLESGFDSLWIYDGPSTSDPLIGGFSGSTNPGTLTSSGGEMTLQFYSDGATIESGWGAIYNCLTDTINPLTSVSNPNVWETTDFTATFTDSDAGGSGLNLEFYQVLDFDGTEWRANGLDGVFNDNFDANIHSDWTDSAGTWTINSGALNQSDENAGNSNLFASLNQTNSNIYLYNWQANMQSGVSSNKRHGIHFFSDDAALPNRGNSYFVYFREDNDKCQIYKVVNDTWSLMSDVSVAIAPDVYYDYKILFDPTSGQIKTYVDDVLVSSWTDTSPHTSGDYISLRSGGVDVLYDDFKVYKSRNATELVRIGMAPSDDVRYQNPNPGTPSCQIHSLVKDNAENWSNPENFEINIDWTPPLVVTPLDGIAADVDTICSETELSANWPTSEDPNSGTMNYWYATGTAPGTDDLVGWTDNIMSTSFTETGLSLVQDQPYYVSVYIVNGAGLISNPVSSDGQTSRIPNVVFYADTTILNLPDSLVVFTDSTANALSWNWIFASGTPGTSTLQNQTVEYNSAGSFDVSLIVMNTFGCTDSVTYSSYIIVSSPSPALPIANFNQTSTSGCAPFTIDFTDASANNPTSWLWLFPGGDSTTSALQNPIITYSTPGTYDVTLISINSFGSDTIVQISLVTVYAIPTISLTADTTICKGENISLAASGGSTYLWNTGQTDSIIVVAPLDTSIYSVMTSANGCDSETDSVMIAVIADLISSLTPHLTGCYGDSILLTATGGDMYDWNGLGMGPSLWVVADSIIWAYDVIIMKTGCPKIDTLFVLVAGIMPPIAGFSSLDTVIYNSNATATFTNNSANAQSFTWDFGDGNTSIDADPWNIYSDTGYYTVQLITFNDYCPNDTLTLINYIHVLPDAGVINVTGLSNDASIQVSPNPFEDRILIELQGFGNQVELELMNVMGQSIYKTYASPVKSSIKLDINTNALGLNAGIYFLVLKTDDIVYKVRILKL